MPEQKKEAPVINIQAILSNLKIRTMLDDMKRNGSATATPAPAAPLSTKLSPTPPKSPSVPVPTPAKSISSGLPEPPAYLPVEMPVMIDEQANIISPQKADMPESQKTPAPQVLPPKSEPKTQIVEGFKAPAPAPLPTTVPAPSKPSAAPQPKVEYRPIAQAKIYAKPEPVSKTSGAKPFTKYLVILVGSALIIAALALGYFYWPEQTPEPSPLPVEQPKALFFMENKEVIEIADNADATLFDQIIEVGKKQHTPGEFAHVLVKRPGEQGKYFTLSEIFSSLGINLASAPCQNPADCADNNQQLLAALENNYSLFLYYQKEASGSTGTLARLGLIAKTKDAAQANQILEQSEPKLVSDFRSFYLGQEPGQPQSFQDNFYKNTNVRFINLPDKLLSFDYATTQDYLLIATSKESALFALDRIGQ